MRDDVQDVQAERATYISLIGGFAALFAAFELLQRRRGELKLGPFELALLGIATYRAGRLVSYDQVTEPLRAPFVQVKEDEYGAGEQVVPQGSGVRKAIGELVSCPTCIGTWIAALLVYGLGVFPRQTRTILAILGASGAAELLDNAAELLSWGAQAARRAAGTDG